MAKALFHKNQKVFVKPVGTWAIVERVLPQWVKGMDELASSALHKKTVACATLEVRQTAVHEALSS